MPPRLFSVQAKKIFLLLRRATGQRSGYTLSWRSTSLCFGRQCKHRVEGPLLCMACCMLYRVRDARCVCLGRLSRRLAACRQQTVEQRGAIPPGSRRTASRCVCDINWWLSATAATTSRRPARAFSPSRLQVSIASRADRSVDGNTSRAVGTTSVVLRATIDEICRGD
jgi:hypothetical protein